MTSIVQLLSRFVPFATTEYLAILMLVLFGEWEKNDDDERVETVDGLSIEHVRLHVVVERLDVHVRVEEIVHARECRP